MKYTSTRDASIHVDGAQTILQGISKESGLFVPEGFPKLSLEELGALASQNYLERAVKVLSLYLSDFTEAELRECVHGAYGGNTFDEGLVAPLANLSPDVYMLELWHGPTCAFKDVALQILPRLMSRSMEKAGDGKELVILVATSGDTGKAALEGFRDVPGTRMLVFYPQDGVSHIQKLQMATQEGGNVGVAAVEGNFDDCQTGVKKIFTNPGIKALLEEQGLSFSSANSINWGRLVPQIVYYVSAYCDLVADEEIALGDPINVAVPTGNFGNILAAYYAREMGVPIKTFVCASNQNNVLTDFIRTGVYDRNRPFYTTTTPSMDILVSSNLERLLFELTGRDDSAVAGMMTALGSEGRYALTPDQLQAVQKDFYGEYCTEVEAAQTLAETFKDYSYLCDTHTAVALAAYHKYRQATGDATKTVVVSTASPYKFAASVLEALDGSSRADADEFALLRELEALSGLPLPAQLLSLREKPVRFDQVVTGSEMETAIRGMLGL